MSLSIYQNNSLNTIAGSVPSIEIGEDNYWYINGVNTNVLYCGKDISEISTNENYEIIITYDDNTTENIGQPNYSFQEDFLTSTGLGGLRYYRGHLQYYDQSSSTWVNTSADHTKVQTIDIVPNNMQAVKLKYDKKTSHINLQWTEPTDTYYDGVLLSEVQKIIIKRKLGSPFENFEDGELVTEINRSEFGQHIDAWYEDTVTASVGEVWYYKFFPVSSLGVMNENSDNEFSIECTSITIYGFRIDQTESDPSHMITYIADNEGYSPAYMDFTTDTFNYGDWADAWFMKVRPCMLKYDGTVDYYLNPNNYELREDGVTASDFANQDYEGNVMIQFPKVYYKCVNISDDVAEYYFSDTKVDDEYYCWSHIDSKGNEIDYCYMAAYLGTNVNSVALKSIEFPSANSGYLTMTKTIEMALANNKTEDIIWHTEVLADRQLINLLLLLISKSTDSRNSFGIGYNSSTYPGRLNDKGLFYGKHRTTGVKIFGIEDYWGHRHRRISGWIGRDKIKMTYGQQDGSTVDGYSTTGDYNGYIILDIPALLNSGYITKMAFTKYGMFPIAVGGSVSSYYTGYYATTTQQNECALVGHYHASYSNSLTNQFYAFSGTSGDFVTSISCKPLAPTT